METTSPTRSATILAFPAGARVAASHLSGKAKFAAEIASLRGVSATFGDGWYHDAAIEASQQDRRS
jgi:hypothetical protein